MLRLDGWLEIYQTVRRHKLRTFLTALSVAWGIFMLVVLLGAGTGLQRGAQYNFRDDAINSIWIRRGKTSLPYRGHAPGKRIQFTNDDFDAIARLDGVEHITARYYVRSNAAVTYGAKHSAFDIRSVHPDHRFLENTIISEGRFLNDRDLQERRKVTVIGTAVRDFLFGDKNALGEYISIGGIQYRVVGVFEDVGGEGELRKIYLPITTAQMAYGGSNQIHQIMFTLGKAGVRESEALERAARETLATRHSFSPDDKRALRIRNQLTRFERINQIFVGINLFIWLIGIGTIIAGIVAVSNIMLISVKERTVEFGVRKALGATPLSIVGMVLQEAVALTAAAGFCGMVAGVAVLELVRELLPAGAFFRDPEVDLRVVIMATVFLIISGALAGFFPARRAAKVNPVVALRDE